MHDRLRMLSYGQRRCEDILWERENPGEETGALMMEIHISDEGVNDTILEQAAGFVQSCQRAEVCMTGRILTEVNGSRPFLGRELTTEVSVGSIRIDYAADWFKKRMWEKTGE